MRARGALLADTTTGERAASAVAGHALSLHRGAADLASESARPPASRERQPLLPSRRTTLSASRRRAGRAIIVHALNLLKRRLMELQVSVCTARMAAVSNE